MGWLLGFIPLLAMSLTFAQPHRDSGLEGRVITQSGTPLAGASVLLVRKGHPDIEHGIVLGTDENGIFHLKELPDALLVQKPGYLPVLHRVDGNDQPPLVVMKNVTTEAKVPLAPCPDRNSGQQFLVVGSTLRIITEEKLRVRVEKSLDPSLTDAPSVTVISYPHKKRETMTIATGEVAFLGYPQVDALAHTDMVVVQVHQEGDVDISGSTQTGRHWRWAFLKGAHVEYYDVSSEVAEGFDRLIGSICRVNE